MRTIFNILYKIIQRQFLWFFSFIIASFGVPPSQYYLCLCHRFPPTVEILDAFLTTPSLSPYTPPSYKPYFQYFSYSSMQPHDKSQQNTHDTSKNSTSTSLQSNTQLSSAKIIYQTYLKTVLPQIDAVVKTLLSYNVPPALNFINQAFLSMFGRGGKRLRPVLGCLISQLAKQLNPNCSVEDRAFFTVSAVVQILHNCSLIVDDIEDKSQMRRQLPCVHKTYGVRKAILAANYFYVHPLQQLQKHFPIDKKAQMWKIYAEQMSMCHIGQAEDLYCHGLNFADTNEFVKGILSEQQYVRMVVSKTGALLRMLVRWICCLAAVAPEHTLKLIQTIEFLSISFQICDDLINLSSQMGKGVKAEDLRQRKITLMVLRTINTNDKEFITLFCKESKSEQQLDTLIRTMTSNGSMQYATKKSQQYSQKALGALRELPVSKSREELELILCMILNRKY